MKLGSLFVCVITHLWLPICAYGKGSSTLLEPPSLYLSCLPYISVTFYLTICIHFFLAASLHPPVVITKEIFLHLFSDSFFA